MWTRLTLAATLLAAVVSPTQAQTDYYARLGLTYSTKLLQDDVIQEIETQQSLAPTLALGISIPIAPAFTAGLEGSFTSSGYHSTEQNVETDLGTLRTGSLLLNLAGPIVSQLGWRAGGGLIGYWPAENDGIFLQGGSARFLVGAGLDFRPRLLSNWDLMASLRYDFHRFTTDELKARGFTGSQGVQRISASIGLARARR
ncbi:MAG TPA: hypothetical protein VIM84_04340 [Gemmatimonadales bacterium]